MASASLGDKVASYGIGILVFGKFITIFSFLFGLGFSVQMIRAEARGTTIAPLYMRRLGVMFLIGSVHLLRALARRHPHHLRGPGLRAAAVPQPRRQDAAHLGRPLIFIAPLAVDRPHEVLPRC